MKIYWAPCMNYRGGNYDIHVGDVDGPTTKFPKEFFDEAIERVGEEAAMNGYFIAVHPDRPSTQYRSKKLKAMYKDAK